MNSRLYQVFVSSPYKDLILQRNAVLDALLRAGSMPIAMEHFYAAPIAAWDSIQLAIDQVDFYILILGGMYGSTDPKTGTSYTELEFDYAQKKMKDIIAFLPKEPGKIAHELCENDPKKLRRFTAFKDKVQNLLMCSYYTDANHLASLVHPALDNLKRRNPHLGWVRPQHRNPNPIWNARSADYRAARDHSFSHTDALNAVFLSRIVEFAARLPDAWRVEGVIFRGIRKEAPRVHTAEVINDDDSAYVKLAELYPASSARIAAWRHLREQNTKHTADYIFGKLGSGVNDSFALLRRNCEWWREENLSGIAIDWRRLNILYDFYKEHIVPSPKEMEARYPNRPVAPGANAIVFNHGDTDSPVPSLRDGVIMQRRPPGQMGGGNTCRLSLLGGGYKAKFLKNTHDEGSLQRTLLREIIEESGLVVAIPDQVEVACLEEVKEKSQAQFCFLGVGVLYRDAAFFTAVQTDGNPEGGIEVVNAKELHSLMTLRSWELSCHAFAALSIWIVRGAPGSSDAFRAAMRALFDEHWIRDLNFALQADDGLANGGEAFAAIEGSASR